MLFLIPYWEFLRELSKFDIFVIFSLCQLLWEILRLLCESCALVCEAPFAFLDKENL